ncbi:hypothetical protein LTR36_003262 [Oleoguttula mirabilis]|uniref:Beta-lactamase/transpeptidase-like protein n=1 Tax=Oleoguttula mirabilis TaxID=1507867 RepID=A0AAV9JX16_9PEZI|nr:hypothetical protein LTR36_003262 [Oleoguttula mirabilis]
MAELVARLHALRPTVEEIRSIASGTGVSVGIIHEAKVVLTDNFGFRDVKNKIPPDQDTIYYLASLSKSFTAAGIAHLISETPDLEWDTPVSKAYPPLSHKDPEVRQHATLVDFLSHRTGLAPKNHIWSQEFARFTLKRGEDIRVITDLEKIADFRSRWIYNNWGYGVADELIEHIDGRSWGKFVKDHIFDPLGLHRTVTAKQRDDDNVAKAYVTLANGEPWEIEEPDGEDGEILSGALAVRSCVRDLLKYYVAFMQAVKYDQTGSPLSTVSRAFVDAGKMVEPYIRLSSESGDLEGSYGLGWVRARLPCTLGALGMNRSYLGRMPTVGGGTQSTTCYYHQGSANSFLTSVYLLPDTESGVVVLSNSMAHCDIADWVGELYLEAILDSPEKNDYVQLAKSSAEAALGLWPGMRKELADKQIPNTPIRPLSAYTGLYYNRIGNYCLAIVEKEGKLLLRFQGEKRITYKMTHYHHDTFSWLISHDHDAKLGRFPITRASFYLIKFDTYGPDDALVDSLIWVHDDEVLEGERFYKKDGQCNHMIKSLPTDHPGPVSEWRNSSIAKLASELDSTTGVLCEDGRQDHELAMVTTELEEQTRSIVDRERQSEDSRL